MQGTFLVKDLLTNYSFGLPSKTMYAREILAGREGWGLECYAELLRVWNGYQELDPPKVGLDAYKDAFREILFAVRDGQFDWERSPIPTYKGRICNGRHRLAAALVCNTHVRTRENGEGPCDADWEYFRGLGLTAPYADSMAIEFCRLKSESRIAVVFGEHDRSLFLNTLGIESFYEKEAQLHSLGPRNLIRELYHGEDWLTVHGQTKADLCYPKGEGKLTVYVLDVYVPDVAVREAKQRVREIMGWHSVHINDTHEETMRIAQALLNDNGIHFLNHAGGVNLDASEVRRPGVAVDSGSVLHAYGLRLSDDIDYVDDPMHREHYGDTNFDDPRNFFWSRGVKYASLPAVRRMKLNRGEPKDLRDVELISWIK